MSARTGMADLITRLRGMAYAGTADYTVGTVSYWTDDQLQSALDRNRINVYHEPLLVMEEWNDGGTVHYHDYYSQNGNWEATTGGTSIFVIEHSDGINVGTANNTPDFETGYINFPTDTGGSTLYLTGRSYDLYGAAAEVWQQKATSVASQLDWSTDNHSISRSQQSKQYFEMAAQYAAMARPKTANLIRTDIDDEALA